MKILISLALFCLFVAEKTASEELVSTIRVSLNDEIQARVIEDPDDLYHVQVRAPLFIDDAEFDVLSLHRYVNSEATMGVAVVVEETNDLRIEGWIHVAGIKELQKHSLYVYYFVPCPDNEGPKECRRKYVVNPIDFMNST